MQSIYTLLAALSENKTKLQDCLARRKSLSVSSHQGINYLATTKSRVIAINFEHPDKKQEVKGKRTATLPKRVGRPLKLVQSARPKIANLLKYTGNGGNDKQSKSYHNFISWFSRVKL